MKDFLIPLMVFMAIPILSFAQSDSMGNTKEVITNVSKAIKKDTKSKKVKKAARKTQKMAKEKEEKICASCKPGEAPEQSKQEAVTVKSAIDGATPQPKKVELFINFQIMAVGKNGKQAFQEVGIPRVNFRDEVGRYAYQKNMTRAQVLALGDEKLKEILLASNYSGLPTGQAKTDAVENALLVNRLSAIKDSALMYLTLEKEMSKASYARKVNFLANFLSYLSDNYDFEAIGDGKNVDKAVHDMDMMGALNESIRTGKAVGSGVCRHMHQMAVRYAQAMGIKEAFGVAYLTPRGAHLNLVLTSPDDPTKVTQINYGSISENKGVAGPGALSQNHSIPDTGIRFLVYNGKDKHAISLPSEHGGILNAMTGGQDSDLGPNYKSEAQIQQAGIGTPYGTFRVFHAETPTGNQTKTSGAAYSLKVNYNDVFYGEYGVAGFTSERLVQGGQLNSKGVYGQVTQGFNWKFYRSKDINLSAFAEGHARGTIFCASTGDKECVNNADYQLDFTAGVAANYHTGSFTHNTSLIFQTQGEWNNATNGGFVSLKVPVVKLSHDTDFKITSSITGNVGGAVTMYNLGTGTYWTYNGHASANSQKTGTYFGVMADGRLTNDTPIWLPGAEHSASTVLNQSIFKDKIYVGVQGKQSFDSLENRYLGFTFGGKF